MAIFSTTSLLILAGCAVVWFLFALLTRKPGQGKAEEYRKTKGRITKCWKDEMEDPEAEPDGDYWVFYEYEWEGQTHKGEDVAEEGEDHSAYATGREVPVWVHPAKHSDSMLHDPGIPMSMSEVFRGPFIFIVVVSWLVILGILTVVRGGGG